MHSVSTKRCWLIATLFLTVFTTSDIYANSHSDSPAKSNGFCYGNSRSSVYVKNNSDCDTKIYCHEISADNGVYYMGLLRPGKYTRLRPSAKNARVFAETKGVEVASITLDECRLNKSLYINSCASPCEGIIDKISLFDFKSSTSITNLKDGEVYYLDELPAEFVLEAIIDGDAESVLFDVNEQQLAKNIKPFYFPSNDEAWKVSAGKYAIKAMVYSDNFGRGIKCDEKQINIEFKDTRQIPCKGTIADFKLYDIKSLETIITLRDGGEYSLKDFPKDFVLGVVIDGEIGSLSFDINDGDQIIKNEPPFTYPADGRAWQPEPGTYKITAASYAENGLQGKKCNSKTITFKVIDENECEAVITAAKFNDLNGNNDITISDGATYSTKDLPALYNIEAIAIGEFESIRFEISGMENEFYTDNGYPYCYPAGDINPVSLAPGNYTLTIKVFSRRRAAGSVCDVKTISFSVEACPLLPNAPCDDGNQETINDRVNEDDCSCAGVCPEITTDQKTEISFCIDDPHTFKVFTNAPAAIYDLVEIVAYDAPQVDPYNPVGTPFVRFFGATPIGDGNISITPVQGQLSGLSGTYYAYVCFKPEPSTCLEFVEYVITIEEDSDGDGTCDINDCYPNNPMFPGTPNTTCDDGNIETINDIYSDDGCSCAGICPEITTEQETEISFCIEDPYTFEVSTNAPAAIYELLEIVAYDTPQEDPYNPIGNPFVRFLGATPISDGNVSITPVRGQLDGLSGTYYAYVCFKPEPTTCLEFIEYVITIEDDSDGDGVCDSEDCKPSDPTFPVTPFAVCNDGDQETINDNFGEEGCECMGVCPEITTEQETEINFCIEDSYTFEVATNAPAAIYELLEIVAYDAPQVDPYNPVGNPFVRFLGATPIGDGNVSITPVQGQLNGLSGTYYAYVCFKPEPSTCLEFVEYVITIEDDSDGDGICDINDCQPNDSSLPGTAGSACNDGNVETIGDIIGDDGCSCAGVCPEISTDQATEISFCKEDSYTFNVNTNAPAAIYDLVEIVAYDNPQVDPYNPVGNPFVRFLGATPIGDGNASITPVQGQLNGLSGTYYAYVCFKPEPNTCLEFVEYVMTIENDSDGDGVCDVNDCHPNDPALPGIPGTACDDGYIETYNDIVGNDGCSCSGSCPEITTQQDTIISFCDRESFTFEVVTAASENVSDLVEIVVYDKPQDDPYNPIGNPFKRVIGEAPIGDGKVSITPDPVKIRRLYGTYYLYICFKTAPENCTEHVKYIADIQRCAGFLSNSENSSNASSNSTISTISVNTSSTFDTRGSDLNSEKDGLNSGLKIYQNKPNPFRSMTDIAFELPKAGKVTLLLTDLTGKTTQMIDANFNSGYNKIRLDRENLTSGIYYYTLRTETGQVSKKMVILD